jgi:hypothetical protein
MIGMWTFFLFVGQVPEFESRHVEILLNLAVEYLTAAGLIIAGIATIRRLVWGVALLLFSFGMLTYTLPQSCLRYSLYGMFSIQQSGRISIPEG